MTCSSCGCVIRGLVNDVGGGVVDVLFAMKHEGGEHWRTEALTQR